MKKTVLVGFLFLCAFKKNLNSFSTITNLVDESTQNLVEDKSKSNLKKTKISKQNVSISLQENNKTQALFFNYRDLTHLFKSDLSVSIDPKNSRINRDDAIKCLYLIEDFGFQSAMSSIKILSPNDVSFLLFKLYNMKNEDRNNRIISFILKNCSLEFDRLKFESLPEVDKKLLLLNLSMPIHMAKKCFKEWTDEKYDINLIDYLSLSSVGLEYFLLLVLTSSVRYPEIDNSDVYSYRVLLTISKLSNDKRFSFSNILETSNEKFFLNLKSAFEKKYTKIC